MEARLAAALAAEPRAIMAAAAPGAAEPAEATEAAEPVPAALENGANVWPDEAAEAAFMSEARERGEPVKASPAAREIAAETDVEATGALPPLGELVQRLSPEVRETLDELFRARFVSVRRVPKKALKG